MLKSQSLINTWKCDLCGLETVVLVNPYFNVEISCPVLPNYTTCSIDLCKTCISTINVDSLTDYITSISDLLP